MMEEKPAVDADVVSPDAETVGDDTATSKKIAMASMEQAEQVGAGSIKGCLLYTSPSPRDRTRSRMPSSA